MVDMDKVVEYSKGLTLLYVEDNDDAREMTTMILEDFFDTIVVAVDGEDGYAKFRENEIDLVITDINMPNLNGLEMSAKIRQTNEEVPIIVLSAHNEDSFFIDSIQIGINGYLLKPIDIDQLTNVIFRTVQKYKYIREAKSNLNLLEIYQEATNKTSLVSKTDTKGVITYVNDLFCHYSGYTKEELVGQNHNIVRHPDNPKAIFEDIWKTISKEKQMWQGIVRNRSKSGKSYYVDSLILPIIDIDGNIIEYISLRHEITDIMNPAKQLSNAIANFKEPLVIYMKLDKFEMMEEFYNNDMMEIILEKANKQLEKRFSEIYEFDKIYPLGNGEYALLIEHSKHFEDEEAFIKQLKEYQLSIQNDKIDLEEMEYDISILISIAYGQEKVLESAKLGMRKLIKINKDFIVAVKRYGVKIAIDDFGVGYSNYERLLDYQPDILKIDGCLIRDIENSSYSLSAVKSIVTFAKEQNIQTIAEFIENEAIFNIVKELGVDFSQGYYFGKPEPLV